MRDYTALAFVVPLHRAGAPPEPLERAPDLPTLVALVRARAPGATLDLFETPAPAYCDGRPICGLAREAGRTIYLCGPAVDAARAWGSRPFDPTSLPASPRRG